LPPAQLKFSSTPASNARIISSASAEIAAFCASTLAEKRARSSASCAAVLLAGLRFAAAFGLCKPANTEDRGRQKSVLSLDSIYVRALIHTCACVQTEG